MIDGGFTEGVARYLDRALRQDAQVNSALPRTSCPSADGRPGAVLVGVSLPGPDLAYVTTRVRIDAEFLRLARQGRPAEQLFRFSVRCAGSACQQWDGQGCGLIERVMATHHAVGEPPEACPIRDDCRWYVQRGEEACCVCPSVVTDSTCGESAALPPRVLLARDARKERP